MVWLALLALLLPCAAPGQQKKAAPKKTVQSPKPKPALRDAWPLVSVTVTGLKNYKSAQVIALTGLALNRPAGKADFDAAREKLMATGAFENVAYRFGPAGDESGGILAVFEVTEVEPLYPIRFERLDLPAAEMSAWLRSKYPLWENRIPPTAAVLKLYVAALEELMAAKGQAQKVKARVVADAPEVFSVVFEPARPEPAVAEVKFTGNQAIPSTVLMNSFAGVAFGTIYRESSFRQMLDASIRPLYDARGRVQVAFPRIATEPSKTVDGLVVTVTVDEGPTFDLGKVEIGGEPPLPAKSLLDAAKFKSGEIANFDEVNASLDRMKRLLQREGYQQPELKVERKLNEREKVVDLLVRIEPGGRYTFGKLTIEGLDINGEAAVRKLWSMQEGKPFNANYPEYFLEQIRERGIFDDLGDTKPVVQLNEEARTADVTLIFRASKGSGETDPVTGRRRRR